ncbi:MAG: hypothetical protein NZ853_00180 [Leptospiraceae bacterium]|nr:hypothetical protein [Leptospiraceae bacterium]MDW7976354.1 hypothetical protein [Leptospiraceae bacterium]
MVVAYDDVPVIYESISNKKVFQEYASKFLNAYLIVAIKPKKMKIKTFLNKIDRILETIENQQKQTSSEITT